MSVECRDVRQKYGSVKSYIKSSMRTVFNYGVFVFGNCLDKDLPDHRLL